MSAILNFVASQFWSIGSAVARRMGERVTLPARVISIGNIQAGGSGKTPLVAYTANQAIERGMNVCILCRGYGGAWESVGGFIAPHSHPMNGQICGDEPALLHDLIPGAWIGVGADRESSFFEIQKSAGKNMDLVILDDGFQNYKIKKDLEIVALTSFTRFQRVFRDFESALQVADLVVWTKGEREPDARSRPWVRAHLELASAEFERTAEWVLVSGVAESGQVKLDAERAGYRIRNHIRFPDHARYGEKLVCSILEDALAQKCKILITGKDWVKWRGLAPESLHGIFHVIEPKVRLSPEDLKIWNRVLWNS